MPKNEDPSIHCMVFIMVLLVARAHLDQFMRVLALPDYTRIR